MQTAAKWPSHPGRQKPPHGIPEASPRGAISKPAGCRMEAGMNKQWFRLKSTKSLPSATQIPMQTECSKRKYTTNRCVSILKTG